MIQQSHTLACTSANFQTVPYLSIVKRNRDLNCFQMRLTKNYEHSFAICIHAEYGRSNDSIVCIGERSKFLKILNFSIQIFNLHTMPVNINNFKLNG